MKITEGQIYQKLQSETNKMREILFIGNRVDNKELVYGSLLYDGIECYIVKHIDGNFNDVECITSYKIIPETVKQFTGQFDERNKRKVFEGDLYQIKGVIYKVESINYGFKLVEETNYEHLDLEYINCSDVKYLGNKFDRFNISEKDLE